MQRMIIVAGLLSLSGCLSMRPAEPVVDEKQLQAAFGDVPIIQVGMTEADVNRLVGYTRSAYMTGNIAYVLWSYHCGLSINTYGGKVIDCHCTNRIKLGPEPEDAITEAELGTMLQSGMTPKQVEGKIGRASCGYCTKPGTVVLLYEKPGIEVEFVGERLQRWQRVVEYKEVWAQEDR